MASKTEVRDYLACWFQLGKHVQLPDGQTLLPQPVLWGDRYSSEFESCWHRLQTANPEQCYMEGTEQTLADLLSPTWVIVPCARCNMPVPILERGVSSAPCPCADLPSWPQSELPLPHVPINSRKQLKQIHDRLGNG